LAVENRPLRRVIDRITAPNSLLVTLNQEPIDLAEGEESEDAPLPGEKEIDLWRDEFLLELLNLEATISRIQLLRRSNVRERERYALEKERIIVKSTNITNETVDLKVKLEETKTEMGLRKEYDTLADKITGNRLLKPREDQEVALEKLSGEIAELEQESMEYKRTWAERREQFGRIVEEGKQMLRMIKDEKEEAERMEGMQGGGDDDGTQTRGLTSRAQTPAATSVAVEGDEKEDGDLLKPQAINVGRSVSGSRAVSKAPSDAGDVEMGEVAGTPALTHVTSEMEEGEAEEDEPGEVEGMDES
jgi:hypothetical protein